MTSVTGNDTLEFGAGITPDMLFMNIDVVRVQGWGAPQEFPDPDADLMANEDQRQVLNIQVGDQGDAIKVMSGKGAIEKFKFADGSIYTWQEMFNMQDGATMVDSNAGWTFNGQWVFQGTAWVWQPLEKIAPHRTLDGTGLAATFDGGIGVDTMLGGKLNDTYLFNLGDGDDVIADFGGINQIAFGAHVAVSDVSWTYDPTSASPFVLNVGTNGDSIAILNGEHGAIQSFSFADGTVLSFDELIAAQGGINLVAVSTADQFITVPYGGSTYYGTNNLIVGGDGADTIQVAHNTSNFIVGGKGDDVIYGGNWDALESTVLFNSGDGNDQVILGDFSYPATLLFGVDVDPASVKVEVNNRMNQWGDPFQEMRIFYGAQGDSVLVNSIPEPYEGTNSPSVRVKFADGTEWSYGDLMARSENMIVADPNAPTMVGTTGNDTYVIAAQSAEYTIVDAPGVGNSNSAKLEWAYSDLAIMPLADRVILEDEPFSMAVISGKEYPYTLQYSSGSLIVEFDNGVTLNIDGFDPNNASATSAIREFKFSNGVVLSIDQLLAAGIEVAGTDAADTISGTSVNDVIQGLEGDDTIVGGAGNDVLQGGNGSDTYVFNRGDGADTIVDVATHWDRQQLVFDNNVLRLGAGIDASLVAVKFDPADGKVYLDIGNGDSVCIGEPGNFSVQSVQFEDGTVWDGWALTDRISVGSVINQGGQTSTISYSALMADGSPLPTWLVLDSATGVFSGTPANVDVGVLDVAVTAADQSGGSTTSSFALDVRNVNDAPTVVEHLVGQTAFAGQSFSYKLPVISVESSFLTDATDTGTPSQTWPSYAQWLGGGAGDNTHVIALSAGNVAVWDWDSTVGNIDTVQLTDVLSSNVTISQDAWGSVTLTVSVTQNILTLDSWLSSDAVKIEQIVFADGVTWGISDIQSKISTTSSSSNDFIQGSAAAESIHALAGDDRIEVAAGDDTVFAGAGNDVVNGGGGSDIIVGGSGSDDISSDWNYTDTVNDFLDGGVGDDYVNGGISNDLLIGAAGNDEVSGDDGNDVFLFNRGGGNDWYYQGWSENGVDITQRTDTISLGGGISYADLTLQRDGNNLILNVGNGESITFNSWFVDWWDKKAISKLQIVTEAMSGYDANSTDPLLNQRIQQFDFLGLANQFEAALAADPTITTWQLAPALADFSFGGSDTSAIGGDMAYLYGKNGNLDGLSEAELRAQLNDASFGTSSQTLAHVNPVNTSAVFTDVDFIHGDSLTYSATLADGSPLPTWLTFDATTQSFSGTPANGDAGTFSVAVIATDTGGLSVSTNFVLTVTRDGVVNVAPVAADDSVTVVADTAQSTIAVADLLANDTDPDVGDTLSIAGFDAITADGNMVTQNANGDFVLDIGSGYQSLAEGETVVDSFTYTIADAAGEVSTATVDVTIAGVNDAPIVASTIAEQPTDQDAAFSFAIPVGTFVDIDNGDVLSYSATMLDGSPLPSWLSFDAATQTFSGTPDNWEVARYSIVVTATDLGGLSASSIFSVDVSNINDAPFVNMLVADQSAQQDSQFSFTIPSGTFDDFDLAYGDALTYVAHQADGSSLPAWLNFDVATQTFSGTPDNGDVGSYSMTVTATDLGGLSASSTFAVEVANVNDAPTVSMALSDQSTQEDAAFNFRVPAGTFDDVDFLHGDSLTYAVSRADGSALPSWLSFDAATQTFTGTPDNWDVGVLDVRVTATDIAGASVSTTFAMDVQNVNDAPIAADDAGSSIEDGGSLSLDVVTLLANDSDPDSIHGDVLNVVGVSQAASGAAVSLLNGAVQYDVGVLFQSLAQGQTATDTFSYTVSDTAGVTSTANVSMTITGVNDAPVTSADDATALQEDLVVTASGNVLANDTDIDQGTVLQVASAGTYQGNFGNLVLNADGSYSYALDNSSLAVQSLAQGQVVTETFAYQATDGFVSIPSTLTVTITGTNDAPVVTADTAAVQEDVALTATGNVLANDTDVDQGTVLTVANAGVFTGQYGQLTLNVDGSYTYALDNASLGVQSLAQGQTVTETFAYQATDGLVATPSTLTVTITGTNDAPVVVADTSSVQEDLSITATGNVLTNDSDVDQGTVLTVENAGVFAGQYGQLTLAVDGSYTYVLDNASLAVQSLAEGQVVTESFVYAAFDGITSTPSTLTISITGTNDAPVTTVDTAAVQEDLSITATGNVLTNDSDVDQGTVLTVANAGVFAGQYGQLTLATDGGYTYALDNASYGVQSLAAGQVVTETFAYQATDGLVATPSTLTVTITGTNDAPVVAVALSDAATLEDELFSFTVPADTFTDIDQGDVLTYQATLSDPSTSSGQAPLPSWLSFDAATRTFTGVPSNWDVGVLNVSVTATDNHGASVTDTFALDVQNVNDAPVVANHLADQRVNKDKRFNIVVPANTFDDWDIVHGDSLTYSATLTNGDKLPKWLTFDAYTRTFSGKAKGSDSYDILLTATDEAGASVSQVFTFSTGNDHQRDDKRDDEHDHHAVRDTTQDEIISSSTVNDIIHTGNGADTIVFQQGDGQDTVYGGIGTDNTLVLGGINKSDIALSKNGSDLILETGPSTGSGQVHDQITLRNWYDTSANYKSVLTLDIIASAVSEFDGQSGCGSNHHDNEISIDQFDFTAVVNAFDQACATTATYQHWSATQSLSAAHIDDGEDSVLGSSAFKDVNISSLLAAGQGSQNLNTVGLNQNKI